ncbi:hypothetical protein [Arthrobacter sp. RT-1]|uniref:RipA family octameric membrane protein n=1 Tax=Arthrobacter sp. RT-1 TaxID=2292263 RepID=UPI001C69A51E|nr:hypothetical protein [Arthrobacter sp. RT-1]
MEKARQGRQRPAIEDIRRALWNDDIVSSSHTGDNEKYSAIVLEQYKIYVEMADRISQRRGLTNTFFLTLNTLIFTLFGVLAKDQTGQIGTVGLILLLSVALAQCAAWWTIVRSYRQLNSGKYFVVGLLEERLPASPYWSAEWTALGKGEDPRIYLPLSHIEQWIPLFFAAAYSIGFMLVFAVYR